MEGLIIDLISLAHEYKYKYICLYHIASSKCLSFLIVNLLGSAPGTALHLSMIPVKQVMIKELEDL